MLHQIKGTTSVRPVSCFSESERACLLAIAEAALPAGRVIPAAGKEAVDRVERYIVGLGKGPATSYRALLHALDAAAYASHLRPMRRLAPAQRLKVLDSWRTGNYLKRSALRVLMVPLKVSHFDNPELFKALGCVYGYEPPKSADQPRYVTERTARAAELEEDEEIECDVVVVGTGAGGAVVARELAERGHAVVLLEEGEYYNRTHFTGRAVDMQNLLYRELSEGVSVGNVAIPIPVGKTVGGTTTINSGTCYRVPDRVLSHWREDFGLTEFTPDHLAPYYDRVEEVLRVAPANMKHVGRVGDVIAKGCTALGYKHQALRRNAPECDGKGVCCLGCPTDAKRSTNVSYVPLALKAGAQLFTGAKVVKITTERGRATGVIARAAHGKHKKLTVRARATVISCGTFYTPVLLEQSGLGKGSGQLGKNLSIHPATASAAWFDEPIHGYNSIPQGYAIEEFHDEGILFEGGTTPIDFGASVLPGVGAELVDLVEKFDHMAMFGFMIEDTSRGRVWNRNGKPFLTYVLNDHDVARLKRGVEILARVFFAAGARMVVPMVHGFDELRNEADLARFRQTKLHARDFDLTAYHPLGTARMGLDPRSSVVSPEHAVHDVPDLYVVDGASVPSSLAVNPQVTIMAMATRAAERLDARLS